MPHITIVTGSPQKLREIRQVLPKDFIITSQAIELEEIQTLDRTKLLTHKLKQAYEILKRPILVEDVAAELGCLNGLPGPFIKFFEEQLGESALYILAEKFTDRSCRIICTAGFYDGKKLVIKEGIVSGEIVNPRGENGWGFDKVFVQSGRSKTNGELTTEEKNQDSHRSRAFHALAEVLEKL